MGQPWQQPTRQSAFEFNRQIQSLSFAVGVTGSKIDSRANQN